MSVKIFFCYAREDEELLKKLKAHLKPLQRQGTIDVWHDRDISAGMEWEHEINRHLNEAQIILLLVSPNFMDSEYCYGVEMKRAIERHKRGEAHVIPIILRHVLWQETIIGKLQALPNDARPIMDAGWYSPDEAFFNVADGIRQVAKVVEQSNKPPIGTTLLIYEGHSTGARIIEWSPDGEFIASGSNGGRQKNGRDDSENMVQVWDSSNGDCIFSCLNYHPFIEVNVLSWSPDGTCITFAWEFWETVRITTMPEYTQKWNIFSGKKVLGTQEYPDKHEGDFVRNDEIENPSEQSPDGKHIAVITKNLVKVVDARTRKLLHTYNGHADEGIIVKWSPDGRRIASTGRDHTVQVWQAV